MSARGGYILAWLNDAIRDRERAARLTESEGGQNWREDPFVYGVRDQTNVMVARSREERAASITHIALNDPASVLRRCAADRKLLELHQAVWNHGRFSSAECPLDCDGDHDPRRVCVSCRDYSGDPVEAPCSTALAVAEGYGWPEGQR